MAIISPPHWTFHVSPSGCRLLRSYRPGALESPWPRWVREQCSHAPGWEGMHAVGCSQDQETPWFIHGYSVICCEIDSCLTDITFCQKERRRKRQLLIFMATAVATGVLLSHPGEHSMSGTPWIYFFKFGTNVDWTNQILVFRVNFLMLSMTQFHFKCQCWFHDIVYPKGQRLV